MTENIKAPTLTVYKASAGSGKTFTLAVEYIKLLISNPRAYEGILAVTFTNKATEEMKMRILSQLYGLWKRLPGSDSYMTVLCHDLGKDEKTISQQAEVALRRLLHNYQFFRVQTIDTFFQAVLRNLAKELQLNANLRVGLNNKQVVEQAVDDIIDSLADDKQLLRVVTNYMRDNLSEDRQWNVIGQIKNFGNTIFKELYKQNRKRMDEVFADKDFFDNYSKEMRSIMSTTTKKYTDIGNKAMTHIADRGLSTDSFSYKDKGVIGYFLKLQRGEFNDPKILGKRVLDGMESSDAWVSKSSKERHLVLPLVESFLMPLLNTTEEVRSKDAILYNSANLTLRHLNDVRLLRRIEDSAHKLNEASGRFMLSDTQSLLHEFIDDADSPFIFEKIGSHLEHIMIDEFQDTSTVQWENFKTLLKECMSQGNSNLIVGDVKQSIYRFRSGDWQLLNDIDKMFAPEEIELQPKKTNWRSSRNVINFNNAFFTAAAELEVARVEEYSEDWAMSIRKAYEDVCQEIPSKRKDGGLVHIELLPKEELDSMAERTLQNILDLLSIDGIEQRDIAILVRNNREIPVLANYIESNSDIRIVSAEAFRLDASQAVNIIISAMNALAHPQDSLAEAMLRKNCGEDALISFQEQRSELLNMTLHDMAEQMVRIFGIDKMHEEGAYVTALFDQLHSFSNDMAPVLEDFLEAWEEEIAEKTIETADCDGVRILTIHKSKGLEFDHVILPYCNWNCNPSHATTIWAQPSIEPFAKLPIVPLDYRSVTSLQGSIYEEDGIREHIQNIVDNLNLLYVAMTRAGKSLFIIGERDTKEMNRSCVINNVIMLMGDDIEGIPVHIDNLEDSEQVLMLTYGSLNDEDIAAHARKEQKARDTDPNVFEQEAEPLPVGINSFKSNAKYRQSNDSRRFADDATDETDRMRMCRKGTVLHQVFASIKTKDDVESALRHMEFEGALYGEGITREELIDDIAGKFDNPQVNEWFSDKWTIYNECTLLTKDGEQRPDRVMTDGTQTIVVDFKFGKPSPLHHEQVKGYMNLLREMGMPGVKGYLWYVNENKIASV